MILSQKYWEPIAPDRPCGEDLSYDPAFLALQVQVRGKEETQFSAAEEPNWREILEATSELLNRFKHLQLGVIVTLALVQTHGFAGLRDGLKLLHDWLDKYWSSLYPQLDPDDNLDPTERVNILQTLSVTTLGDPCRFCHRLAQVTLCQSKTLGQFSLHKIKNGAPPPTEGGAGAEGSTAADPAQVAAAFRDSPAEFLQERFDAVSGSLATLKEMEVLLAKLIGGGQAPNFEALKKVLVEIQGYLSPYVRVAAGVGVEALVVAQTNAMIPASSTSLNLQGAIESREEVLRALRAICEYYQRREPSSPVPFLLHRAQRLVNMDFMQIMNDLAPEALAQMKAITGGLEAKEPNAT